MRLLETVERESGTALSYPAHQPTLWPRRRRNQEISPLQSLRRSIRRSAGTIRQSGCGQTAGQPGGAHLGTCFQSNDRS